MLVVLESHSSDSRTGRACMDSASLLYSMRSRSADWCVLVKWNGAENGVVEWKCWEFGDRGIGILGNNIDLRHP
jgi:hypothetical protein